jgi:hypothetical protein
MTLHILLCDEVLPYFISLVESRSQFKLLLNNSFVFKLLHFSYRKMNYFQNCFRPRNPNRPVPHSCGKAQHYQPACPASPARGPYSGPEDSNVCSPAGPSRPYRDPTQEESPTRSSQLNPEAVLWDKTEFSPFLICAESSQVRIQSEIRWSGVLVGYIFGRNPLQNGDPLTLISTRNTRCPRTRRVRSSVDSHRN